MPLGPKGLPLVGNLLDVSISDISTSTCTVDTAVQLPSDRYCLKIDEWIRAHGTPTAVRTYVASRRLLHLQVGL